MATYQDEKPISTGNCLDHTPGSNPASKREPSMPQIRRRHRLERRLLYIATHNFATHQDANPLRNGSRPCHKTEESFGTNALPLQRTDEESFGTNALLCHTPGREALDGNESMPQNRGIVRNECSSMSQKKTSRSSLLILLHPSDTRKVKQGCGDHQNTRRSPSTAGQRTHTSIYATACPRSKTLVLPHSFFTHHVPQPTRHK